MRERRVKERTYQRPKETTKKDKIKGGIAKCEQETREIHDTRLELFVNSQLTLFRSKNKSQRKRKVSSKKKKIKQKTKKTCKVKNAKFKLNRCTGKNTKKITTHTHYKKTNEVVCLEQSTC